MDEPTIDLMLTPATAPEALQLMDRMLCGDLSAHDDARELYAHSSGQPWLFDSRYRTRPEYPSLALAGCAMYAAARMLERAPSTTGAWSQTVWSRAVVATAQEWMLVADYWAPAAAGHPRVANGTGTKQLLITQIVEMLDEHLADPPMDEAVTRVVIDLATISIKQLLDDISGHLDTAVQS